ncbi:MBL fold metallo-hydrolase [Pacificimonas sp. WHA3]|uniref:MBL fold metallo-hydrolase n=1 Tax=Pacificimonas pallii TaxID=2827236 RepID=A0ABS6SBQ8_9SPHN|nr:MBL fold metallo-hydrolase [Pacificimonas pallii]MBV7255528.1 MBL fold metallo-hydrolase [Pacificimonas pallii]
MSDQSLTQPPAPERRRGLTYPLGRWSPEPGELHEIAAGVRWLRMPMPFSLDHINLWVLDGGDHHVIVDTAIPAPGCKDVWRRVLDGITREKPVGKVLCTHYHPDHIGNAGWLIKKTGATLVMAQTEYLMARMLLGDIRDEPPEEAVRFYEKAGWPDAQLRDFRAAGWGRFARAVSSFPVTYERIRDGQLYTIGDRTWRIVTGSGHTPEHACLVDDEGGLMIAGDQVLPRITSNVSVHVTEPMADPLGDWLASIDRFRSLSGDLHVLPAHGFPFHGLHARLDQLAEDHYQKLTALERFLARPRTALACFEVLFHRAIDVKEYGIATGEAIAHLRWLEQRGRAVRETHEGRADIWRSI